MSDNPLQPAIRDLVKLIRKHELSYEQIPYVVKEARQKVGLVRTKPTGRRLPKLLSEDELDAFFAAVLKGGDAMHYIMLRLMYETAMRVAELVNVKVQDINIPDRTIFVTGKGDKDRYVDFSAEFKTNLLLYMQKGIPSRQEYLFESMYHKPFTTRAVGKIVKRYAKAADLEKRVFPHLFRHQQLTHRLNHGMTLMQVKILAGHTSVKTTERYLHLCSKDILPKVM